MATSSPTSQATQRVVNSNPACCSIPPVTTSSYIPKGTYVSFAGFDRVYVTGPSSKRGPDIHTGSSQSSGQGTSDIALVSVFDIFGFFPQTQQGADLLAASLNASVYMPDFFAPDSPFPIDRFPPKTQEDKDALQAFFAGPAKPEKALEGLLRVGEELRKENKKFVGVYGMCWGGKVAILSGSNKYPIFDAVAALHPAMLSADDANNLAVPLGLFISKDEPKEEYDNMIQRLSNKPFADQIAYKLYPNMFHGWAAARADLENDENKKEFEDVYSRLKDFFSSVFGRDRGGTHTSL